MTALRLSSAGIYLAALAAMVVIAVSFVVMTPQNAAAGGAVGGTGDPGGCSGGCGGGVPHTSNGYGWYNFSTSSGGPASFKGGGNWDSVRNACISTGNNSVIAFAILRPTGGVGNSTIYNYLAGDFGTYYDYNGNDGGGWLSYSAAYSRYLEVDASLRSGYSWGSNVAWFCWSDIKWTISTTSAADKTTAKPGDKITWTHTVKNNGAQTTDKNVTWHYQNRQALGTTAGTNWPTFASGKAAGATASNTSTYTVLEDDVDKNLCRATSASPVTNVSASWTESSAACVFVPYNYTLTPTLTIPSDEVSDGYSTVRVDTAVQNSGPTKSRPTEWRITRLTVSPGGVIPNQAGGVSNQVPCNGASAAYFKNANTTCLTEKTGTSVFDTGGNVLTGDILEQYALEIEDYAIGTKLCFAFSVRPHSSASGDWRHSEVDCITIGKRPKVQVHGGDLSLGKKFLGQTVLAPLAGALTSTTVKRQNAATAGTYDPRSISGFHGTGVDASGVPIRVDNTAVPDPHWSISTITPGGRADAAPCQGDAGRAFAVVTDTYNGKRSPVSPTSGNTLEAWSLTADEAKASWIGANPLASNTYYKENNPSATCEFPANFSTQTFIPFTYGGVTYTDKEIAFTELAPVWNYTTNFTVNNDSSCTVDLNTIQLNLKMSVDDEATIYVNGIAVATKANSDLKAHDEWPRALVSVLTNQVPGAFKIGTNTLTVAVKSHSTSTGLIVGGDFSSQANCQTPPDSKTFGSWVEYGIFATGTIGYGVSSSPSLASGSAYGIDASAGLANATICNTSMLSFTNADTTSGCSETADIGNYANTRSIPDVASSFPTEGASTLPTNNLSDPVVDGVYTSTTDVTLPGGEISVGRWVVINAPDVTVTITGDIVYSSATIPTIADIPQLIIIAKNIIIADTVQNIDAWLIAKGGIETLDGTINTCGVVGGAVYATTEPLTSNICNLQLKVNGPVMANKLFMRRTYGSGPATASGDPAEVFNLRPDAYLWAANLTKGDGRIKTVYSAELPPRL